MGKITKESLKFLDVTFNIFYEESSLNKDVFFIFHGFGGNKEDGFANYEIKLAESGFLVIVLDACEHGERVSEDFALLDNSKRQERIIDLEIQTAKDAISVYNHLLDLNMVSSDKLVNVMGVSMGAAITFYLASIFKKVNMLISIIGSPSFVEFYKYKQKVYGFPNGEDYQRRLDFYKAIDPLINYENLIDKKIYMSVGLKDKVVPLVYAKTLTKKLNCVYQEYDLGHEVNKEMLEEISKFIQENR